MPFGDGAIVRKGFDVLVDFLHRFAAPTGTRGSVLLMTGGLIILGFLLLALLFRSAIVGDLAPAANGRAPTRRALLPPADARSSPTHALPAGGFEAGRSAGAKLDDGTLDAAFDLLRERGADARILQTRERWKRIRIYRCLSCDRGASARGCEHERGLIVGAFEALSGNLAKAHEVSCRASGAPYCEFDVSHAPLREAP